MTEYQYYFEQCFCFTSKLIQQERKTFSSDYFPFFQREAVPIFGINLLPIALIGLLTFWLRISVKPMCYTLIPHYYAGAFCCFHWFSLFYWHLFFLHPTAPVHPLSASRGRHNQRTPETHRSPFRPSRDEFLTSSAMKFTTQHPAINC